MRLAVVTGLAAEARIARGPGAAVIVGAGRADELAAALEAAIAGGARRIISFGIAGALEPNLRPGDLIIGRTLIDGAWRAPCDRRWSAAMIERLRQGAPRLNVTSADIAAAAAPVADSHAKAALRAASGAAAVDMESGLAARAAERHGLPFAILRAIADPAHRRLPPIALSALRADGGVAVAAVIGALARRPAQAPGLMRLAFDARKGLAALSGAHALLGADFAGVDFGEL
jgi:hopanoid-associated phosphorylase